MNILSAFEWRTAMAVCSKNMDETTFGENVQTKFFDLRCCSELIATVNHLRMRKLYYALIWWSQMKPTKEPTKVDIGPHIFVLNNHSKWTQSPKTKCINIFQENLWEHMGLGTSFNWWNRFNFFSSLASSYFALFSSISLFVCSTPWWNQQIG